MPLARSCMASNCGCTPVFIHSDDGGNDKNFILFSVRLPDCLSLSLFDPSHSLLPNLHARRSVLLL